MPDYLRLHRIYGIEKTNWYFYISYIFSYFIMTYPSYKFQQFHNLV